MTTSLNNNSQQFHQYQLNEQSPYFTEYTHTHTHTQNATYDVGKLGPGLGQRHTCGRVKPVNVFPPHPTPPVAFLFSNYNGYINKIYNTGTDYNNLKVIS